MANNNGSSGILIVLGILVLVFLAPALLCGGMLGIDANDTIDSGAGWLCSLGFWVLLGGGVYLLIQINRGGGGGDDN
jgi:hypothetical protein